MPGSQKSQAADIQRSSFASYIVLMRKPTHIRGIQTLLEAGQNGFPIFPLQKDGCKSTRFRLPSCSAISPFAEGFLPTSPFTEKPCCSVGSAAGADKCVIRNAHGKTSKPVKYHTGLCRLGLLNIVLIIGCFLYWVN